MNFLAELISGARKPDIYRCEPLAEIAGIEDVLAEKGWQAFYLDGRSIEEKQSELEAIARALSCPTYVARNWDALEEAVRDLDWAPGAGYLVIYEYPQIFAAYQPQDWQTFLSILRTGIAYWRSQDVPMYALLCRTDEGLAEIPWV